MATFPIVAKYVVTFRPTDTGLLPQFQDPDGNPAFRRVDTLAQVTPPAITEISGGSYYFEWTWDSATDPDILFQLDGGASIVTDVERWITGRISPRDYVTGSSGGGGGGGSAIKIG